VSACQNSRQEQEDPSVAHFQPPSRAEVQETPVRDGGFFRAGQVFASLLTGGSPSTVGDIKRPDRFCSFDQAIYGHLPRRNLAALATERGDHAEAERFGPMS
jgi:hypothetical protein